MSQQSFWDKHSWLGIVIGVSIVVIPFMIVDILYLGPQTTAMDNSVKQMDCKTLKDHLIKSDLNKWFIDDEQLEAQIIGRCS